MQSALQSSHDSLSQSADLTFLRYDGELVMSREKWPELVREPAIAERCIRAEDADGMHRRVQPKLIAKICLYILDHLLAVADAEQIGFADENHGIRTGLIKRLYHHQIILCEPCTGIDQHDPKIAPRQIRDGFLCAGN